MGRTVVDHESKVPSMKRIGVIGGFGQWATLDILNRILKVSTSTIPQYGNRGYPPFDLRMLNRAPMVLNEDGSYPDVLEPSTELLEAARFVGKNADFLILPSNTPHLFSSEIEKAAGKPLLNMINETVDQVVKKGFKKVGILAIGLTLKKGLYQKPLTTKGVESVVLSKELSDKLDKEGVYPLQEGASVQAIGDIAYKAVTYLRGQKVKGVILGCTEIPILLGEITDDHDIINPSQILAEAAVKRALENT